MSTTTSVNRSSSGISRLARMQVQFQARQLAEKENKLINFLEERQEAAVRRINAGRESAHSANSLTSSSNSSSNSVNGGRTSAISFSKRHPPALSSSRIEKSSPVGWDKSYPLKPVVAPGGHSSNNYHQLPPAPPASTYGNQRHQGSPTKYNKYSGNYGPKSRGTSLDRNYADMQRAQKNLFMSRTKSSVQLMPGHSPADDEGLIYAKNKALRRGSSGALYRGSRGGGEEDWYEDPRRATSSYTREYVRNLPTSVPNSASFVVVRNRSQTRVPNAVGRSYSTNTNTDSGLEQSSYSSQSSDKSDFISSSTIASSRPPRPIAQDSFSAVKPPRSHSQISRVMANSMIEQESPKAYDPPRTPKINTKTFRKPRPNRSMSRSPEPIYPRKLDYEEDEEDVYADEEEEEESDGREGHRRLMQEQKALYIRHTQEQKQLQDEMQQREKELLKKIQEQQKELELVKKSQAKVTLASNTLERKPRSSQISAQPRTDVSPSKPPINSRKSSFDELPMDNARIDRSFLRRRNREDTTPTRSTDVNVNKRQSPSRGSEQMLNGKRSSPSRGADSRSSPARRRSEGTALKIKSMAMELPSSGNREDDHPSSKAPPSRRKSTSAAIPKKKPSSSSAVSRSSSPPPAAASTPSARRSIFQPKPRDDLDQCSNCGRNFAPERIEKHVSICVSATKKKRKAFDMTKKRVQGTEAEAFLRRASKNKKPPKEPKRVDWRKKREDFINALRAAKEAQRYIAAGGKVSDLPPPPPMDTSDYISCPHCKRKFNESAADRHIPKCKDIKSNKRR